MDFFADADVDGFGDAATAMNACEAPAGFVDNSEDCDDSDPTVHPDAGEGLTFAGTCTDEKDNDCDGTIDTADPDCDPCQQYDQCTAPCAAQFDAAVAQCQATFAECAAACDEEFARCQAACAPADEPCLTECGLAFGVCSSGFCGGNFAVCEIEAARGAHGL